MKNKNEVINKIKKLLSKTHTDTMRGSINAS